MEASRKQAEWEGNEGGARDELVTGRRENDREERSEGGRERGSAFLGDSARWSSARERRRVDGQRVGWMDGGERRRGDRAPL